MFAPTTQHFTFQDTFMHALKMVNDPILSPLCAYAANSVIEASLKQISNHERDCWQLSYRIMRSIDTT